MNELMDEQMDEWMKREDDGGKDCWVEGDTFVEKRQFLFWNWSGMTACWIAVGFTGIT